jgi:plastocyanin
MSEQTIVKRHRTPATCVVDRHRNNTEAIDRQVMESNRKDACQWCQRALLSAPVGADTDDMTSSLLCRSGIVVFAATAALTSLSGCGGADSNQADVPTVDIELGNYVITPNLVSIGTGVVNLHVTNTDAIEHNLTVGGRGTRNLAPGEEQTVSVDLEVGSYDMWCDVPGHAAMGQTGTLVVAEPVATTP